MPIRLAQPPVGGREGDLPRARAAHWCIDTSVEGARLYDLIADPLEARSELYPVQAGYLLATLWRRSPSFSAGWQRPPPPESDPAEGERDELERALGALGYVE